MVSNYNIISEMDNSIYVFNTLKGSFFRIDQQYIHEFRNVVNNEIIESKMQEFLWQKGFFVESKEKEQEEFSHLENDILEDGNQMTLIILPTEKCNFRCEYCYEDKKSGSMTSEDIEKLLQFVEENIVHYSSLNVEWFGGEPLVAQSVINEISLALIKICNENKKPYSASMTTNGYYLTVKKVAELKKLRVIRYQITLDGMSETHNNLRFLSNHNGTWEVIVKNLQDIRDTVKSSIISIIIRTNLTREIYNNIKEYISFVKKEFGMDNRFSFLFRIASDWGGEIKDNVRSSFIGKEEYINVIRIALKENLKLHYFKSVLKPGGLLCYAWKKGTYIVNPKGEFVRCTIKINEKYNVEKERKEEYYLKGHPKQCITCNKLPVCLKVNCNFSNNLDAACEYDIEKLEELLPLLATKYYGCQVYEG